VNSGLDVIEEDLLLKKKFWQYQPKKVVIVIDEEGHSILQSQRGWNVTGVFGVGVQVLQCNFDDPSACAFNVESIQLAGVEGESVLVSAVEVDNITTDIEDLLVFTPTNVLLDWGVDKLGASSHVFVFFDEPYTGPVEFNGEKPQGMELCTIAFDIEGFPIPSGVNPCPIVA
jgi:hypothetical protein